MRPIYENYVRYVYCKNPYYIFYIDFILKIVGDNINLLPSYQ